LIKSKVDFAFETTLSTKSYNPLIRQAKAEGYTIVLIFCWLESIELAIQRVEYSVKHGGHNIPEAIIERRYHRGLVNFFHIYQKLSDVWILYNNSEDFPSIVAKSDKSEVLIEIMIFGRHY
jgi:predicted ABC-type ATPase